MFKTRLENQLYRRDMNEYLLSSGLSEMMMKEHESYQEFHEKEIQRLLQED